MNEYQPARVTPRGQVKCFQCREIVRIKDGAWQFVSHQQVFLCTACDRIHAIRMALMPAPAFAVNRCL